MSELRYALRSLRRTPWYALTVIGEFEAGSPVIAVSQRAAKRYWPGQPAVGQTLTMGGRPFAVVGVVPDVRFRSLDAEPEGEVY
ncbi:MAG: hypothetical protein A3H96_08160 [Acidobacteria bacterium RIFCSPLOWO2_02_FULL_67_36]|nr:MAG: hypothetical protein A3H96_08160 [Acidobacteria bacterium RIFCSPLOWO2_02_FULL_67_36]OFW24693.1 MAG: hypothetical protein A3G21_17275 [Acidobacteria bacterium RIFCSPLOWO2_12_FULL_66_21]